MKVGISFVSTGTPMQNLRTEDPGWSVRQVATAARPAGTPSSDASPCGVAPPTEQHTFYTALYHSLLFPNVVSDVSGRYDGSDGQVHTARAPRGLRQLLGVGHLPQRDTARGPRRPRAGGDMVQSLVDDAQQNGWLPKWAIVGGDESQMNGDSADPIIADALAMGVRNFDVPLALKYMVKGADRERDRPRARDRAPVPDPVPVAALRQRRLTRPDLHRLLHRRLRHPEYAIDDFAIAQVAAAQHDTLAGRRPCAPRRQLGVPLQSRHGVHPGPRHRRELPARPGLRGLATRAGRPDRIRRGQRGPVHLVGATGPGRAGLAHGRRRRRRRQARDASWLRSTPPATCPRTGPATSPTSGPLGVRLLRRARARPSASSAPSRPREYADAPVDEPGNDDLGALSSWYVWAAIGLFPVTPGRRTWPWPAPFPLRDITLPDGRRLVERAPGRRRCPPVRPSSASRGSPDQQHPDGVRGRGHARARTRRSAATALGTCPGSRARCSFGRHPHLRAPRPRPMRRGRPHRRRARRRTAAMRPAVGYSIPSGGTTEVAGVPSVITLGVAPTGTSHASVRFHVEASPGLAVSPGSGTLTLPVVHASSETCSKPRPA